ncbi:hypothetical protein [Actinomadura alba]|uniref:Uncharacterized protein n=1 Tax=Actinomadura alba TaxID=406431 RepID=A0ABR7LI39_9ACTN|nr:hypothetical protein [Actinomadura alba]MBC6464453.1 hypothetical protein [Actinomadura alba]
MTTDVLALVRDITDPAQSGRSPATKHPDTKHPDTKHPVTKHPATRSSATKASATTASPRGAARPPARSGPTRRASRAPESSPVPARADRTTRDGSPAAGERRHDEDRRAAKDASRRQVTGLVHRRLTPGSTAPAHGATTWRDPRLRGVLGGVIRAVTEAPPVRGTPGLCLPTTEPAGTAGRPTLADGTGRPPLVRLCLAGSLISAAIKRVSPAGPDRAPPPSTAPTTADLRDQAVRVPAAEPSRVLGTVAGTAKPAPDAEAPARAGPPCLRPVAGTGRRPAEPAARIARAQAQTDHPEPPVPPTSPACDKETRGVPKPPLETVGDLPRPGQARAGGRPETARHIGAPTLSIPAEDPALSPD